MYAGKERAKELWESLERNYKIEDAGIKKFVIGHFLDYKMVDSKIVMSSSSRLANNFIRNSWSGDGFEWIFSHGYYHLKVASIIERFQELFEV